MSKIKTIKTECVNCNKDLEATLYCSINEFFNPELVHKLINNELNTVKCECGQIHRLNYPILYHKMGLHQSIMLQYVDDKNDINKIKCEHELLKHMIGNTEINIFGLKKNEQDIFEVYSDWDIFLDRVRKYHLIKNI